MRILFINHSTSRTGAPIVLLHFLKWLKKNESINFDVLSLHKGELLEDFSKVCDTHFFHSNDIGFFAKLKSGINKELNLTKPFQLNYPKKKLETIAKNNYDLIYANTIISVPVSIYLKKVSHSNPKLILHLHELNLTINSYCPNLQIYKDDIDLTIAVSNKVKDNLVSNWEFEASKINVVYAYSKSKANISKSSNEFIVGGSGLVYWRKGPDYFNLVAKYVFNRLPDASIKFQWVGKISEINRSIYEEDLRKMKIEDKVMYLGVKKNPYESFSNFDIFLMTSKEDPFPLVCVEVGMMGKPIICFEGATGTEEVLRQIEGSIVPYLDVEKMGDMVIKYFNDRQLLKENSLKTIDIFNQFTPENQCVQLFKEVKELIARTEN